MNTKERYAVAPADWATADGRAVFIIYGSKSFCSKDVHTNIVLAHKKCDKMNEEAGFLPDAESLSIENILIRFDDYWNKYENDRKLSEFNKNIARDAFVSALTSMKEQK